MVNTYGLPDDSAGADVSPPMGNGSVQPMSATPRMAKGGAIPEDDFTGDSSPNTDVTDYSNAMELVRKALDYGRAQHGLPASRPQQSQDTQEQSTIPDEQDSGDEESYAEGGAIADDIEAGNNSQPDEQQYGRPEQVPVAENGEAPPISTDNTDPNVPEQTAIPPGQPYPQGGDPVTSSETPPAIPEETPQAGSAGNDPMGAANPNPQQVVGYLQGKGAAPQQELEKKEAEVHGDAAQKAQGAVVKATQEGGPAAGFAMAQANRQLYNAKAGFAYMALNGTAQKPPDIAAAAKAATQATPHLLDGTLLTFAPEKDGVTASANGETFKLTIPQFNQFLDIRKSGQYDKIFEQGGGLIALKEIMKGPGEPTAAMQTGTGTIGQSAQAGGQANVAGGPNPYGRNPETGQAFTEGNRPSTPSESGDMAMMRRNSDMANAMASGDSTDKIARKFGPDPRPMAGANGVVSFPGYKAYQQKYDQGRNTDGGPDTTGVGKPQNSVRVVGQGEDRTYKNGVDQTPNAQEKALELIRAKNEGRGTPEDKIKVKNAEYDRRDALQAAKDKAAGGRNERTESRKEATGAAGMASREKIAANKLIESAANREAANGRNAVSSNERLIAAKLMNGQALTPQQQAVSDQLNQRASQVINQQPTQAPQSAAPQDQAAILWARANPADPRAAKIMQLHGLQ